MRILVVDDSKAMRMIVMRTLRQAGYGAHTIVEASSAKGALDSIHQDAPQLILADWNMGEMSGLDLLNALNTVGLKIKFGFVTSESTAEMAKLALEAGARFLLTKPFTADDLKAAVEKALEG